MSTVGLGMSAEGLNGETGIRMEMLTELLREALGLGLDDFVLNWMQLPETLRKGLASMGCVFSREEVDPVENFETKTFCPGNWCYSIVLKMLCPRLLGEYREVDTHGSEDWTADTRGTICKGILGAHFFLLGATPTGGARR